MKLFILILFILLSAHAQSSEKHTILSDEEFAQAFDILARSTDHEVFIAEQILQKISNKEIQCGHFLDIGCGPGRITKRLMPNFASTTIVEPNENFANRFQQENCQIYQTLFEDFAVDQKFDLILCSHVFYHIPKDKWKKTIEKMIDYLSPNGVLVIAMETPSSEIGRFISRFNQNYLGSILKEAPKALSKKVEVLYSDHFYHSDKKEDLYTLFRFCVIEDCFTPSSYLALSEEERSAIDEKILAFTDSLQKDQGEFRIGWTQELLFFNCSRSSL